MNDTLIELNKVFCDVFRNKNLVLRADSNTSSIDGWDSLTHMLLVAAIEKHFGLTFTLRDVMQFRNAGDIAACIQSYSDKKACR
ncbi:MAG: acyl carrier protein [Bacteroidia bacterium]